ncbi:LuxR C-terminal-related transcriptional regulator [Paenibacillus sp. TRM 82003]|nr:LuxR C-terminal-related transcriptional regulator [Paenibacillus sp. TRM 82003]
MTETITGGLHRKLTLISASAGYGKTALATEWLSACDRPVAWLSLDEGDNDLTRFLTYLIAATAAISEQATNDALRVYQSPQPPPFETIMTMLVAEWRTYPEPFVLVLDDYHTIRAKTVHRAMSFLLENLPAGMHVILLTREEPDIPLARLRLRHEVTDLGIADLRFRPEETAEFLSDVMNIELPPEDVASLNERAEGWIAGLQIAAISWDGRSAGSEPIVPSLGEDQKLLADYMMEEVLNKQEESVQKFLLFTSILDRLCESLCDAVMLEEASVFSRQTLLSLERANLFIVPLDPERRWYRYHQLFAESLRRKAGRSISVSGVSVDTNELHIRASAWYERNGFPMEAFRHAVAANNVQEAARLAEGDGMPLHLRGESSPVLNWLESLPRTELDARPSLWVIYGSALLMAGKVTEVEPKLQAAEAAMSGSEEEPFFRNMVGFMAATRAAVEAVAFTGQSTLAERQLQAAEDALLWKDADDKTNELVGQIVSAGASASLHPERLDAVVAFARRAMAYLHAELLPVRMTMLWLIGFASHLRGDPAVAREAYSEAITMDRRLGGGMIGSLASVGLGNLHAADHRLYEAEECYRNVLLTTGDLPMQAVCEAYMGLARIYYEWNELENAMQHAQQSMELARQALSYDTIVTCQLFVVRVKLACGDSAGAAAFAAEAKRFAHDRRLLHRFAEIADAQALVDRRRGTVGNGGRVMSVSRTEPLTPREREILLLVAQGLSNREIGERLFLALDTVKGHNRRIFEKLQVQRRTEAIAIARSLGWIE